MFIIIFNKKWFLFNNNFKFTIFYKNLLWKKKTMDLFKINFVI